MIQILDDLRFVTTVATGMDGVISIDENLNIVLFNEHAQRMFGYSEKEMLGKSLDRLLPPEITEKHNIYIKAFMESGSPGRTMAERQTIRGMHADGHSFAFEASISQSTFNGHHYCTVVLRDITPLREKKENLEKIRLELEQRLNTHNLELQHSHSRLSEVQRLSQIGIWELDIETNELFWSDEVFEIFELDQNKFKASYEAFLGAIHPEDRDTVNHVYKESVENKRPYQVRHRLLMKDGRVKYVEERCETFYNNFGEPNRSVGTIQDITSQVTADQQRRHLQNLLLRVEALAEIGSWEWNIDSNKMYWSPEMYRQYGIKPSEVPDPCFDLATNAIHPEDKAKVDKNIKEGLKSGVLKPIEYRLIDPENNIRHLRCQGEFVEKHNIKEKYVYGFVQDISRYVKAEQEIKDSNRLLQAVLDTTHVGIAYLDCNMNFIRVNRAYASVENKDPEYFVGKNHFDLYPNRDNEEIFRNTVKTGKKAIVSAKPFEYAHNPERGISHWDWTLTPVKATDGKVNGLVLSLLDVTERINAIEIAQENEEKLKVLNENLEDIVKQRTTELVGERNFIDTVLETQGALVTVINRLGHIVLFNRACEETSGFSAEELRGKPVWDCVIPPDERPGVEQVFNNLTTSAIPSRYENHWLTKDGNRRLIDWSNSTISDDEGNVRYVIATGIDVTERRRTERQLRRISSSLKTAQRIAKVGSWEHDLNSNKLWWSEENYRIFGQKSDNFTPSREAYLATIHSDDVAKATLAADQLLKLGYKDIVHRIITPDGDIKVIHEMAEVEYDEDKNPVLLRGTVQDVTEKKRADDERNQLQRQLQQAQKMESIGQLTGGIAHDFNNILSAILGFTRLAITRFAPDKQGTLGTYLEEIEKAGNRASDLVKQMLAFSRGDTQGYTKLEPLPIINDSIKMLRSTIPSSIDIVNKVIDDKIVIKTDALQLQQTLINLIINARDALDDKGEIEIKLYPTTVKSTECISCHQLFSGKYIAISIKDTGCGINPEIATRIFEPFFTTKTVGQGSGMGLAMVHGFMHTSGGHIQIETRRNHGTKVTLYFPSHRPTKNSSSDELKKSNPPNETTNSTGKKILVVDDEEPVTKLICEFLQLNNYEVDCTTSSLEALNYLKSSTKEFDLLITDQTMPELTGLDLIREVRKYDQDIPIIICSGYSNVVNESNAVEKGASCYLSKPIDETVLIHTVNYLLNISVND